MAYDRTNRPVTPTVVIRIKGSTAQALNKKKTRPDETMDAVIWRLLLELRKLASGGLID
jgi:hypothetical protein